MKLKQVLEKEREEIRRLIETLSKPEVKERIGPSKAQPLLGKFVKINHRFDGLF